MSIGDYLRSERVNQGISLSSLAAEMRINPDYLEAIETDQPARIPGGFFYRSFTRQYARVLGIDLDAIEPELDRARQQEAPVLKAALEAAEFPVRLKVAVEGADSAPAKPQPRPSQTRTWIPIMVVVAVVICTPGVFAVWSTLDHPSRDVAENAATLAAPAAPAPAAMPVSSASVPEVATAAPEPVDQISAATTEVTDTTVKSRKNVRGKHRAKRARHRKSKAPAQA